MTIDELIGRLADPSPPATAGEVARFEALIGARLPDDYRDFLARCNGGRLDRHCEHRGVDPDAEDPGRDVALIGGLRDDEDLSLVEYHESVLSIWLEGSMLAEERRRREMMIPIAMDAFGNRFELGIAGEDRGRVAFRDLEDGSDPEWIADTFADFVAGIGEVGRA